MKNLFGVFAILVAITLLGFPVYADSNVIPEDPPDSFTLSAHACVEDVNGNCDQFIEGVHVVLSYRSVNGAIAIGRYTGPDGFVDITGPAILNGNFIQMGACTDDYAPECQGHVEVVPFNTERIVWRISLSELQDNQIFLPVIR